MRSITLLPKYVVVDLREPAVEFMRNQGFYFLFQRYPLHKIIQTILAVNPANDPGHEELFWLMMEDKFQEECDRLDFNTIAIFYELLTHAVDDCIRRRFPTHVDPTSYIFDRWIDNFSAVLKRDEEI